MISICADDFGQNKAISEGILALAHLDRLDAISCMTELNYFENYATQLRALSVHTGVHTGLHFNLTHQMTPLYQVIARSLSGLVDRSDVQKKLDHQLDRFEKMMKKAPDFIDGHQHVHALPIIRDILIKTLKKRYTVMPTVRNLTPLPHSFDLKVTILHWLTRGFTTLLQQNQIPHNTYFAGLYDLKPHSDFKKKLQSWFEAAQSAPSDTLIMCHPGYHSDDVHDPIRATRFNEFKILASPWFLDSKPVCFSLR